MGQGTIKVGYNPFYYTRLEWLFTKPEFAQHSDYQSFISLLAALNPALA